MDDDADADGPDPSSIRYSDFFEPPPRSPKGGKGQKGKGKAPASPAAKDRRPPAASAEKGKEPKAANENENEENSSSRRTSVRFNDQVAVRQIKARKNAGLEITPEMLAALGEEGLDMDDLDGEEADEKMEGDEEEEDGDDDEEGMEEESDGEEYGYEEEEEEDEDGMNVDADGDSEGQETAQRVSADLFADEPSSSSASAEQLSAHERRQASLAEEIAALEAENVGKRDWTLMGEAGSRARPVNSLLEEDLEFEHTAKATPVITEETTEGLEDLIKRRILDVSGSLYPPVCIMRLSLTTSSHPNFSATSTTWFVYATWLLRHSSPRASSNSQIHGAPNHSQSFTRTTTRMRAQRPMEPPRLGLKLTFVSRKSTRKLERCLRTFVESLMRLATPTLHPRL